MNMSKNVNDKMKQNKESLYLHRTGGVFKIWKDEDFSDGTVLLYGVESGEDFTVGLENFDKYFTEIR